MFYYKLFLKPDALFQCGSPELYTDVNDFTVFQHGRNLTALYKCGATLVYLAFLEG